MDLYAHPISRYWWTHGFIKTGNVSTPSKHPSKSFFVKIISNEFTLQKWTYLSLIKFYEIKILCLFGSENQIKFIQLSG